MKIVIFSLFLLLFSFNCIRQVTVEKCNCQAYFNWDTINKQNQAKDKVYSNIARLDTLNDDGCDEVLLIN